MTTFQAVTPGQAYNMAASFGYAIELTNAAKANRDWALAAALDAKADSYFADGNVAMGKVCRARALGAANRAVAYSN